MITIGEDNGKKVAYVECECFSTSHRIAVTKFGIDDDCVFTLGYVEAPWYRRLVNAIKYVFAGQSNLFTETLVKNADVKKLAEFLINT